MMQATWEMEVLGDDGLSEIVEITPLDLIQDRTSNDAQYARSVQSDVSEDLKGAYNASDLNRVETNCEILANYLQYLGYACTIETKTDWVMSDIPYLVEHVNRIRYNVIKIIRCFLKYQNEADAPTITTNNYMNYIQANNIEISLQLTIDFINHMMEQYPICGQHICGELY